MSKFKQIVIQLLPLFAGMIATHFLWQKSIILACIYLAILIIHIFVYPDRTLEFKIAVVGFVWALFLEIISTQVSGFHSFAKPDFMGIPLWLVVVWGYGFVLGKRITSIMYTGSAFKNK